MAAGLHIPTVAASMQPAVPMAIRPQPAAACAQLATTMAANAQAAQARPVLAAISAGAAVFPGPVAGPAPAFGPPAGTHLACDELEAQAMQVMTPEEAAELQHKLSVFRAKMASIEGVSAV